MAMKKKTQTGWLMMNARGGIILHVLTVAQSKTTLDLFHLLLNGLLHAEMYPLCFGFF